MTLSPKQVLAEIKKNHRKYHDKVNPLEPFFSQSGNQFYHTIEVALDEHESIKNELYKMHKQGIIKTPTLASIEELRYENLSLKSFIKRHFSLIDEIIHVEHTDEDTKKLMEESLEIERKLKAI